MSTITLEVEDYFRPRSAPCGAAGSATKPNSNSLPPGDLRQAPQSRTTSSAFFLGGSSKSSPDLTQIESPAALKGTWSRPGAGASSNWNLGVQSGADKPPAEDPKLAPFVDVPLAIRAFSPDPTDSVFNPIHNVSHGSPATPSSTQNTGAVKGVSVKDGSILGVSGTRPPPLRKLKSSLKLPQLTRSYSESQISPKSVRFASRLEKVKMFDGTDSPSAVSIQNSPMGSPRSVFLLDDYFSIRPIYDDVSEDEDFSSSDSDSQMSKDTQYKIDSNNFVSPKNIYDKRNSPVYLQSVSLTADKKSLVLLVMCQNLAFEKQLSLKFTLNNWQSSTTLNSATYIKSFSSVNFDQFKFTVPLAHLPSSLSIKFCIRYAVNNTEYWDNNDSKNYEFALVRFNKPSVAKEMFSLKPAAAVDSFTYKPPTFSPQRQFDSKKVGSGPMETSSPAFTVFNDRSSSPSPPYNELVRKLISVKNSEEKPKFTRKLTSSPKPRYSQSYMAKRGPNSGECTPTLEITKVSPENKTVQTNSNVIETKPSVQHKEAVKISVASSAAVSATLSRSNISQMSYADLLQNYCFNGADIQVRGSRANPLSSYTSSCNSSSASLSSGYLTPVSGFQSVNDSFIV